MRDRGGQNMETSLKSQPETEKCHGLEFKAMGWDYQKIGLNTINEHRLEDTGQGLMYF